MQKVSSLQINIIIFFVASLLFVPFLGNVHLFDWDEINFAESAREMIVTGDYLNVQINYELFWEKPPLFVWMQVVSMKLFGINEFSARFPNALSGIITLLVLFNIGRKYFNKKFGIIWVFAYAGSVLPHFYFKSGIIDPWFNLFIFLGIFYFMKYLSDDIAKRKDVLLSAVFIGLATLTKGPVALLIFLLTEFVFLILNRFKIRIKIFDVLLFVLIYILVGGFWFILQMINGNFNILYDFVIYQIRLFQTKDAGHGGFLAYHFVILFFGVFPASIFALKSFVKDKSDEYKHKVFKKTMMILLWVVLILFSIVKTKIVHYSSLAYFPLTFLAAFAIYKTDIKEFKKSKIVSGLLIFVGFVFAAAVFLLQYIGQNHLKIISYGIIDDEFANGNLRAVTSWTGFEFLLGVFLIVGIITSLIYFKNRYLLKVVSIFSFVLLFTNLTILIIVPEVEKISQKSAVDFYQKHKNEDAYFITYGMKSYAHYFYTRKDMPKANDIRDENVLYSGKINKTVYVTCRNNEDDNFASDHPNFIKLYEKNGYVFWKRSP